MLFFPILQAFFVFIPFALAGDKHTARDVLMPRAGATPSLSGAAVPFGAGTYPRATRLADGSLVGAYTAKDGAENVIRTVISRDQGASWTALGEVTRGVGDIDNPFVLQLQSGRVLVAFRNHSKDANGNYTFFRITICFSDDGGRSWQFLSQPASDPAGPNGNWEPFMRLSSRNANVIQLYYSRENAANDQDSLMRTSTDGGANWSTASIISGQNVTARDGMVGVATCGGNNLIAIFESVAPGETFRVWSVTSADDGQTWGNRRQVYVPTGDRNNAGAPQIVCVGGTTLVASFMTDEDTSAHQWPGQAAMKVLTSTDFGASWGHKTTVFTAPAFWPGLLALNGTTLLALADKGGSKVQRVVLL